MCGNRSGSDTLMLSSRIFRNLVLYQLPFPARKHCTTYWSTDFKVPMTQRSFFSSTVTTCSVSVLNTL